MDASDHSHGHAHHTETRRPHKADLLRVNRAKDMLAETDAARLILTGPAASGSGHHIPSQ